MRASSQFSAFRKMSILLSQSTFVRWWQLGLRYHAEWLRWRVRVPVMPPKDAGPCHIPSLLAWPYGVKVQIHSASPSNPPQPGSPIPDTLRRNVHRLTIVCCRHYLDEHFSGSQVHGA